MPSGPLMKCCPVVEYIKCFPGASRVDFLTIPSRKADLLLECALIIPPEEGQAW